MGAPGHERERRKRRRSSEQSPRRRDSFNQRGAQSEIDEDETTNPNQRRRGEDSEGESAGPGGVELEMVCALVPYDEVHAERNAEPDSLRKRVGRRSIVVDQDRMEIDAASYRGVGQTPRPVNRGGFGPGMDRDLAGLRP